MKKRLFNQQSEPRSREAQKTWRLSVKARIMMALLALMLMPQGVWAQGAMVQYYDVYVNGTQVTSDNRLNVLSTDPRNNNRVVFQKDASGCTLTLYEVDFDGGIICGEDNLTIELLGTAASNLGPNSGFIKKSTTVGGDLDLTIKSSSGGSLTIGNISGQPAIDGFATVTLDGVYASNTTPFYFDSTNKCYKDGNGNNLSSMVYTTTPTYMLWVGSVNDGYTQAIGGDLINYYNNIRAGTVSFSSTTANGNVLTLNGATIGGDILSDLGDLKIVLEGNNTITYSSYTYGNEVSPFVSTNGGTLTFDTDGTGSLLMNGDAFTDAISGFATVEYKNGLALNTTTNQIKVTTYPLTVAGTAVTSANQKDVLTGANAGKVSYNHDATTGNGTLTLNGATITGYIQWDASETLTIDLNGENSITNTTGEAISTFYTLSPPTIIFTSSGTGNSKLTLTSDISASTINSGITVNTAPTLYDLGEVTGTTNRMRVFTNALFSGGDGTPGNPFLIKTKEDLKDLATYTNTGQLNTAGLKFLLDNDIDCTGLTGFELIGNATHPFIGSFESITIHKITNLTYTTTSTTADVGLFGVIGDATNTGSVANVCLENCTFAGGNRVGGVVGYLANGSIFQCSVLNSTISSAVTNGPQVGGIAGAIANGSISVGSVGSCTIIATADGSTPVAGGLVGRMDGGLIQSCLSDANTITSISNVVAGDAYAAALVGFKTGGDFGTGGYRASYSSNVKTETNVAGASEPVVVKKSGNMPRGIGNMNDMSDQASLADVFKTTLNYDLSICLAPTPKADTYYKYSDPDVYAARSTDVTIVVTPNDGFRPTLSLSDATTNNIPLKSSVDVNYASGDYSHTEFTFSMPSADVDATVGYNIDVSSNSFTPSIDKATYSPTGSLEPTKVNLKKGDTTYTLDATNNDFTISNATLDGNTVTEFNKAGTYSLTIQGGNGNIGTRAGIDYKVEAKNIADATINASVTGSYSYTGSPITPTLSVKDGSTDLVSGATGDYIVSYKMLVNGAYSDVASIIDAGAYQIVLKGQGNYKNERTLTLTVDAKSVDDVTIDAIPNQTYTGTSITPALTITDGSKTLNLTTDYTVVYKDNTEVGTATVTVTGTGNYTSSRDVTFKIEGKDASNFTVGRITDQIYSGSAITPTLTVSDGGKQLAQGTDYDVTFSNNVNVGTATATVTGIGNYTGSIPQTFSIIPKSIKGVSVTIDGTYTYTGAAIVPADADITVTDGNMALDKDKDYTLSVTNNTNAGTTAEVIITGKGNYDSATNKTGYFTIGQADLAGVTIDAITNQAFTGSALMPPVSVKFNGTTVDPSEYNVNYTNNTNVGTATVTLTSTNKNFSTVHSKDANFEIVQTTASITAKDQTVIYNGTPQAIPGVSVDYGTVVITYYKSAADRTANTGGTTTAPTNAATYYVKVTQGDAGYTSVPAEVTFTISPKSATGLTVNVGGTYTYTGSAIEPADADIVVKDGSTTLVLNTDYTITSCTNNTNAATSNDASAPTVTITGMGNYDSSTTASGTFTIGKADFAGVTIDAITNQAFTGSALMPPVSVKFNGTTVDPSEYNVNYTNNTNVGTATVTLTSTNINFSTVNSKVVNFTIAAASATITATNQTVTYNGIPQAIPGVSVDNGMVVITYYNSAADRTTNTGGTTTAPTNAATYYVRVTQSDASYTSVPVDVTFTISPKSANGLTVTVGGPYTYTGSAIEPALSVTDGRTPLTAGTDYTVSYTSNVNVGTATATVTCIGNYTGSIPKTFSIIPKSIKGVSVTIDGTYTYTGAAIVPADADITVTDGNMALDKDKDYTLSVTNNTNAGTATVTVTGKGNYDSATSETGSFTIDQATITSVTLDQTQFVYAPGVAHSVNVTVMAGSLSVPSGSYTVTVDGVTGNSATAAGTHTVRATARTDIANNFKGYAETTFAITERTVSIDFGGRTFRTFYDGNETFLLPDGITAYIVTGVNGNVVTVKQVSYVLQGIPVLLESTPGTTNVADPAESFTGNLLQYAATATPATDKHYVLYNNEFVRASGTINGKVYLDLTGYSGGARSLVIGDGTTAIEGIVSTEDDGDVKWYDMQGRRINKPTKSGVYIKDGKKVVVKTRY